MSRVIACALKPDLVRMQVSEGRENECRMRTGVVYTMRYAWGERGEVMRYEVGALVVPNVHQRLWNAEDAG